MEIWRKCKLTNKEFNTQRAFLNNLRTVGYTSKEYYDEFYKKDNEEYCYCGNIKKYKSFSYNKYCSSKCHSNTKEFRKLISERFVNKPEKLEIFRKKRKLANVDNNVTKRRNTIKMKCIQEGITEHEYYSRHAKNGHKNISEDDRKKYVLKRMDTIEKNGIVCGRSGYKQYPFFNTQVSLQGYEPIVLDWLIYDYKLCKNDIKIGKSNIPIIKYNKGKLYFPDFYLPKYNLIIEVKSEYTLNQHYDNVMDKCKATIKSGYSILLLVLSKQEARNRMIDGSKKLLDWAISSQAPNPIWYGEGSTTIPEGSRIK